MKMLTFARRNVKEILRDPMNLAFGLGFPVALMLLLSAIQSHVPVPIFEIGHLTPGIAVFGLSFMTLFSATIVAKDKASSLLHRLYTTPLSAGDFILGYTLPILPMAVGQSAVCCGFAIVLGLRFGPEVLLAVALMIPSALLYTALGLLCGSLFTDKQVGGICGALLTNLTAWLSGAWFDLELVGGVFGKIAYALPFVHAVEMERAVLAGDLGAVPSHLAWVAAYAVCAAAAAVWAFTAQMKRQ